MNTTSNAMPDAMPDSQRRAPASGVATRPWYWSVRREVWEHRSIYLAPLIVAVLVLLAYVIRTIIAARFMRNLATLDLPQQQAALTEPFALAASLIILVTLLVAMTYCLAALQGERRDRSILFWKSLPVSDFTIVLSKASVPLLLLPLIAFVMTVLTQLSMLLLASIALKTHGMNAGLLWTPLHPMQSPLVLLYGLAVLSVWYAPFYSWLLLVSCWSRRATFLWALSPLLIVVIERHAFDTDHFAAALKFRALGFFDAAFTVTRQSSTDHGLMQLSQLAPAKFLATAGLWRGLIAAAVLLATTVWLRRRRVPE